ncbi:MAG: hypothetical protein J6M95_02720 [Bacilli bacterium]|nr:hypothetical protein [Bacilli bacterium]
MAKRKGLTYEQKLIDALKKLPNPIIDKRHNLKIYFIDDRARSNQSRFEHIINQRHGLRPSDFERIERNIKKCIFKKDLERAETYNLYIRRNNIRDEYIKISVKISPDEPDIARVKTIFITRVIK